MILVTGGTGFIGTHLLERLAGYAVRPCARWCGARTTPRVLPAGVEAVYGDLATGEGYADALDGVETVIHLAGVTKALHTDDYLHRQRARHGEACARSGGARAIRLVHVSSLAAIGPARGGRPVGEDAEPHPLTHYGKSKLEAERVVRDLAPEAVIVRPPVVYGPRDTDVFQLLKSISKGLVLEIAGGERWFSAIYVKDLVEGLLAAARAPRGRRADVFPGAREAGLLDATRRNAAAAIMARTPRVVTVPFAVANAVGACGEIWSRSRASRGSSRARKLPRRAAWRGRAIRSAPPNELGFIAPTSLEAGSGRESRLVQGGRLAGVLKADTRFWAVDKVILAYFAFAVVILLGWWKRH